MDLPTCPACKQSVLDDDAVDCPFCGAAMDGSSPPKKVTTSSAPATSAGSKPSAENKSKSQVATQPAAPETSANRQSSSNDGDADPFAVETSSVSSRVRRARRKPARGCMHRVICPMCEIQGFVPKSAAGEEIRCANPKCLVPVFTAPPLPKKEEPKEEPTSSFPMWLTVLLLLVFLGGAGGGIWFFVLQPGSTNPAVDLNQPITNPETNITQNQNNQTENTTENQNSTDNTTSNDKPKQPTYPSLTIQEQQERILTQIVAEAQSRRANRSKPFCRRLAAETYALANNIEGAEGQLKKLNELSNALPYYNIQPLVQIAWQQLKNGQNSDSAQTTGKADELSPSLPKFGRGAVDAATALAAALCAHNKLTNAQTLLDAHEKQDDAAQLSAQIHIVICLLDRYRDVAIIQKLIDNTLNKRNAAEGGLLNEWLSPQHVAVAADLLINQQFEALQKWVYLDSNPVVQTQAILACVDLLPLSDDSKNIQQRLIAISSQLPQTGKAAVLARMAFQNKTAGQSDKSAKLLAQAVQILSSSTKTGYFDLGDPQNIKMVLDIKYPDAGNARLTAISCLECARAAALHENLDTAKSMLNLALGSARSFAPSLPAIQTRLQSIKSIGERGMLQQIKDQLKLSLDTQARTSFRQYKKNCEQLLESANARHKLETEILIASCLWGLHQVVWDEIQNRDSDTDINRKANYEQSNLMSMLAAQYEVANQKELAITIRGRSKRNAELIADQFTQLSKDQITTQLENIPALFENLRIPSTVKYRWALLLTNALCRSKKWSESAKFVRSLRDPIWKEDCMRLAASIYAHAGQREEVLHHMKDANLNPTEAVSVYRGLIVGLHDK